MTRRGSAANSKLTSDEYERILRLSASIEDEKKSVECFFYHLGIGYNRMRPGTLSHYLPSWYDPERKVIEVPSYQDCDCGGCKKYARDRVKAKNDLTFDEALAEYWTGKEDSTARDIPLRTRRQVDTVERFNEHFGHLEKPVGSYMTIWRRMTRIIELMPGIDTEKYSPYVNRATAVTHFAWSGMDDSGLLYNFGWARPQTIESYRARSGQKAAAAMDRMYGRDPDTDFRLDPDPPTWADYRPESAADLIEVDAWTPQKGQSPDLPPEDEEEALKEMTLSDFLHSTGGNDSVKATTGPLAVASVLKHNAQLAVSRAARELRAMIYDDKITDPTTVAGAAHILGCSALLALLIWGFGLAGYPPWAQAVILFGAGALAMWTVDMDEPSPDTTVSV